VRGKSRKFPATTSTQPTAFRLELKMRLIHTQKFKIEEFTDDKIPAYAILSHTWGSEEVSFQAYRAAKGKLQRLEGKAGFKKIKYCCAQAKDEGIEYCWVDTCCT
jgi:hypothetical protein